MSDAPVSLIDRLAGLTFRTKLFATGVVYMLVMFALSEATGDDLVPRLWFATTLPVVWGLALLAQWLSMRPRPAFAEAVAGVVASARRRPFVAVFYAAAAVAIEAQTIAWALGRSLIPDL